MGVACCTRIHSSSAAQSAGISIAVAVRTVSDIPTAQPSIAAYSEGGDQHSERSPIAIPSKIRSLRAWDYFVVVVAFFLWFLGFP
jgi:hypothetical protein